MLRCTGCGRHFNRLAAGTFCSESCRQDYLRRYGKDSLSLQMKANREQAERLHKENLAEARRMEEERRRYERQRAAEELEAIEAENRRHERRIERLQEEEAARREQERIEEARLRDEERKRDRRNWYAEEWVEHLKQHPKDVFQCDWSKLNGSHCADLFSVRAELAEKAPADWTSRLTGNDWIKLVEARPEFGAKCVWKEVKRSDLFALLVRTPDRAKVCQLSVLSPSDWVGLIDQRPMLAEYGPDWGVFEEDDIAKLVDHHPKLISKCKGKILTSRLLRLILEKRPTLSDLCDLKVLSPGSWSLLLQVQPSLADKCKAWDDMEQEKLESLLKAQPILILRCKLSKLSVDFWVDFVLVNEAAKLWPSWDRWCEISVDKWIALLQKRPAVGKYCKKWNEFSTSQWEILLKTQPSFIDRCDLGKLSVDFWVDFVLAHEEYSKLWPSWERWSAISADQWCVLLKKMPALADYCTKWDEFSTTQCVDLILANGKFFDKCTAKDKFIKEEWRQIIENHPEFANTCPLGREIVDEIAAENAQKEKAKEEKAKREKARKDARDRAALVEAKRKARIEAKWGSSAKSISWRIICSCVFMGLYTYTWYSDSPCASSLEAWCSIPLCLVVLVLILTGHFILPIVPLVAYWAVFEDNHPGTVLLFSSSSLIQISSFAFFSCSVWAMRGRLLPTILFGAGLGWVLSYWPWSIGLCSATVLTWSYIGLTVLLGVLSLFGVGVVYRWRTTFFMYALLLLSVLGRAYLCGHTSEQGLRKILMSINEKTSYVFADCISNLVPSKSNDVSRCDYGQAVKYRDGVGVDRNVAKARDLFERAVESQEDRWEEAEWALIKMDVNEGDESKKKMAVARLKRLADQDGHEPAKKLLGDLIFEQAKGKNTKEVIPDLERATRYGSVEAMLRLGKYYVKAEGFFNTGKDEEKAAKYLKMAAEKGSVEASKLLRELD